MNPEDPISLGAHCILQTRRNGFFLVAEIEAEAGNVDIEEYVFIRISRREANALLNAGAMRCQVTNQIPTSDNLDVTFVCVLILNGEAFALFDVENNTDDAVLVTISVAEARRLIRRGARQCTVINRRIF
ncbi:hypothetical protein [Neobacillus cucumis]|uniref:Spore coat protein n=1 Tax=Neobacillus cucumis TaxID=1740721 RepID=A0A2N5HVD1_9BACI|nr:hypothetical protein [Neobacillus cucumis]PLS09478.1 hypothetical protein CVD27_01135 [Neobacillus cucumis]